MAKELKITITGPSLEGMAQDEQSELITGILQTMADDTNDDEREGVVPVLSLDGARSDYHWKVEEVEVA